MNPGEVLFVMQFPHDNDTAAFKLIINNYYDTCIRTNILVMIECPFQSFMVKDDHFLIDDE